MRNVLIPIAVIGVLSFGIAYEVSVWNECLGTHSFFYCARVLGH